MEKKIILYAKDCVKIENKIYFISLNMNLIFSIDINDNKIELITHIPNISFLYDELMGAIDICENKLVIAPNKTNEIWIYDIDKREWNNIERDEFAHIGTGGMLQIVKYNNYMYLIGSSYPAIIKLDVSKMKAEYIKEPFIEKVKKMGELKDAFFRTHHAVRGEWLYLASCVDNTVLKFNLKTNEYKWLSIGSDDNKFSGIVYSLNDFWLSPRTTEKIIKWDGMNGIKEISLPAEYRNKSSNYFLGVCFDGESIIFPNILEANSVKINIHSNKMDKDASRYMMMKQLGDSEIISESEDGCLEYIRDGKIIFRGKLEVSFNILQEFLTRNDLKIYNKLKVYTEGGVFALNNYINYITGY